MSGANNNLHWCAKRELCNDPQPRRSGAIATRRRTEGAAVAARSDSEARRRRERRARPQDRARDTRRSHYRAARWRRPRGALATRGVPPPRDAAAQAAMGEPRASAGAEPQRLPRINIMLNWLRDESANERGPAREQKREQSETIKHNHRFAAAAA